MQASLTGIPDELFLKVVLQLVAGDKPPEVPAAGPPAICLSADDVPSLWALVNTSRDIQETFARCLQRIQTQIAITHSPNLLKKHNWSPQTSKHYPLRVETWDEAGYTEELQLRHRCKPPISAPKR